VIIERIQLLGQPAKVPQTAPAAPRQATAAGTKAAPAIPAGPVRGRSPKELDRMAEEAEEMELAGMSH
jgi:hypothetical protein